MVELEGLVPRELDILGKVIGQNLDKFSIPAFIQQRLICEFGLFVRLARRSFRGRRSRVIRNREMEVQSWGTKVSEFSRLDWNI